MDINKVGVVGSGLMGSGIIQVCAQSGFDVNVTEMDQEALDKGITSIDSLLSRRVKNGKLTQKDKDATIKRIFGSTDYKNFSECDLVIEAVFENMELKKKVFKDLDKIKVEIPWRLGSGRILSWQRIPRYYQ